ncbi:MAG: Eco57I restriction-modification methylase domain-containing protein [Mycobacteriales bacterium]
MIRPEVATAVHAEVDLLDRIEALRVRAIASLNTSTQARFGQYFTPRRAAELIAAMPRLPKSRSLRVLDPGAGSGMLMAAMIYRLVTDRAAQSIHVTAVELDESILPMLHDAAQECVQWAERFGCDLTVDIKAEDFIDSRTGWDALSEDFYDLVVINPPYAKLPANSAYRHALISYGVDCPNLYAAFLTLGADALNEGGELVTITPRSFANGPYFEQFRKFLLRTIALNRVHTFESRSTVFSDTGVLQENIVLSGTKGGERSKVRISVSNGHTDDAIEHVVPYEALINRDDRHQFLRLALGAEDILAADTMASMPATLDDLNLKVSTGRVVDFRAHEKLRDEPDDECAPLIYPGNLQQGVVDWPRAIGKAQGFAIREESDHKALVPPGCYVLVKRFSAKEETRRIVAAVWDPEVNGDSPVAVENHLNVFHDHGNGLSREIARGLSIWLNSTIVDRFFRTFSGHTQVNATDLRTLRFPSFDSLSRMSGSAPRMLPDQARVDRLVESMIRLEMAQ